MDLSVSWHVIWEYQDKGGRESHKLGDLNKILDD